MIHAKGDISRANLLLGGQFLFILLAVIPFAGQPSTYLWGIILLCSGLVLGAWTLTVNSPENFNLSPLPKVGARLCFEGPYRYLRHPLYLAVILAVGGIALCNGALANGIAWVLLVLLLDIKARYEEKLLEGDSGAYRAYMERSWRFIPLIY